jgi:mitochondrial import inner membrane translocase subunit TIM23
MTHRQTMSLIEAREREFFKRIQRNRVDPTAQSATNPVPDFYGTPLLFARVLRSQFFACAGEKIGSLHEYRQVGVFALFHHRKRWLK